MINEEVLEKRKIEKTLILKTRKRQLTLIKYTIIKEGLEIWTLTGYIEAQTDRGKQHIAYLKSLFKCLAEQGFGDKSKSSN